MAGQIDYLFNGVRAGDELVVYVLGGARFEGKWLPTHTTTSMVLLERAADQVLIDRPAVVAVVRR